MVRTVDPFPTSGLQSAEREAVRGRTGTPGVCLRWVDQQSPNVPMLPGMGKILIDADSDTGREILAYFPTEAFGPRRRTVATVGAFLGQPQLQSVQHFILVNGASVALAPQQPGWRKP